MILFVKQFFKKHPEKGGIKKYDNSGIIGEIRRRD